VIWTINAKNIWGRGISAMCNIFIQNKYLLLNGKLACKGNMFRSCGITLQGGFNQFFLKVISHPVNVYHRLHVFERMGNYVTEFTAC
jgi:uncharacterized protein involved in propanediol utilization